MSFTYRRGWTRLAGCVPGPEKAAAFEEERTRASAESSSLGATIWPIQHLAETQLLLSAAAAACCCLLLLSQLRRGSERMCYKPNQPTNMSN
jgi:hypothetical protein